MKSILLNIFYPIISRYRDILRRIHDVEVVQNTLLFDTQWQDDPAKYLNGQKRRQEIVLELKSLFNFKAVIETGTFIGNTTGYFAKLFTSPDSTPPVMIATCELDKRFHALAVMRLKEFSNITYYQGDSREFLAKFLPQDMDGVRLIYLDAHWHSDLPLRTELQIIKDKWPRSIVMIDDFEVPGDFGYNFDDYGVGRALKFSDFRSEFKKLDFIPYSPRAKSNEETGARRGTVLLALKGDMAKVLDSMTTICRAA